MKHSTLYNNVKKGKPAARYKLKVRENNICGGLLVAADSEIFYQLWSQWQGQEHINFVHIFYYKFG